jgi:hypothetical protein
MTIKMQFECKGKVATIDPIEIDDFLIDLCQDKAEFIHQELRAYIQVLGVELKSMYEV